MALGDSTLGGSRCAWAERALARVGKGFCFWSWLGGQRWWRPAEQCPERQPFLLSLRLQRWLSLSRRGADCQAQLYPAEMLFKLGMMYRSALVEPRALSNLQVTLFS